MNIAHIHGTILLIFIRYSGCAIPLGNIWESQEGRIHCNYIQFVFMKVLSELVI